MKRSDLTEEQWHSLGRAPLAVFGLVACADGAVSAAERKVFVESWLARVDGLAFARDPVIREIFKWVIEAAIDDLPRVEKMGGEQMLAMLRDAARILQNLSQRREAREYVRSLLALADEVAAASRGRFGLGAKVGADEEKVLFQIRSMLRIRPA